ncbi:MAG: hypothetical protein HYR74_01175 [Candidatus Eisenbacteria bacterium]|nr:hypothetical protein [Candidatus Eisenbacteria bacterium]
MDAVSGDLAATLALGIDLPPAPEAARLSAFLARAFGGATVALIHYGSHTHDGGGPTGSAFDFFVVVDDYRGAYRALAAVRAAISPAHARHGRATTSCARGCSSPSRSRGPAATRSGYR